MEAQKLSLKPGETADIVPFVVYVEDDKAVPDRYCWLLLFDSQVGARPAMGGSGPLHARPLHTNGTVRSSSE